jgi:hypothetical protein
MMKGQKIYLRAVRALPRRWVSDETRVCMVADDTAVAANPNFAPIKFYRGKWSQIKLVGQDAQPVEFA